MHEVGYKWPIFYALKDIAGLLTDADQQAEAAVRFLGAAAALRQETGISVAPAQQAEYDHILANLRQQFGDVAFDTLWKRGARFRLPKVWPQLPSLRWRELNG